MNNPQFKNELSVPFQVPTNLSDKDLREWLIEKVNLIDATKRNVTEQMSRYHDETLPRKRGREYFTWIKSTKSFKSHLTEERTRLSRLIHACNERLKADRQIKSNCKKPTLQLSQCFMMVAEDMLDADTYRQLENRALLALEA
jgi:predicted metal-dependent hydrolase